MTAQATPPSVLGTRRGKLEKCLGLPPRPKTRTISPDTDWQERAACGRPSVPQEDRAAFVTVQRQADAWPLVARYCSTCPVARECLAYARAVHSSSLSGGYVLDDGRLAPDRPGAPFLDPEAWVPPWEREDDEEERPLLEDVDPVALPRNRPHGQMSCQC